MIKFLVLVVLSVSFFEVTNTSRSILQAVPKPPELANEKGCYVPDLKRVLSYGQPYSPADGNTCRQYICHDNGDTVIATCGVIKVQKGDEVIDGDKSLPYPQCCDTIMFTGETRPE